MNTPSGVSGSLPYPTDYLNIFISKAIMTLLVLGRGTDFQEIVSLVTLLSPKFEIEVEDIDGVNSILYLEEKTKTEKADHFNGSAGEPSP
jgi:hypothetical protein